MTFVIFGMSAGVEVPGTFTGEARIGAECRRCLRPVCAVLVYRGGGRAQDFPAFARSLLEGASVPNSMWTVIGAWPEKRQSDVPELLSPAVERAFIQGEKNLAMEGCEEPAATMFRRALDLGLKEAFPAMSGNLAPKIKKLAETGVVPLALADWADEVRIIGNDGAHDIEGCSYEDAVAARDLVDAVLRYLFSLPRLIESRRAK